MATWQVSLGRTRHPDPDQRAFVARKDRANVLRVLVSNLRSAMVAGRKLYGRRIRSFDDFFDAIDRDRSGHIDTHELAAAMKRLGLGLSQPQLQQATETPNVRGEVMVLLDRR